MQQRQLRLGDILDDYCPRERRITNHAVVAMIAEAVRQTRCATCDTEHEYKQAKVPPQRKRKSGDSDLPVPDAMAGPASRVGRTRSPSLEATASDRGRPAPEPAGDGAEPSGRAQAAPEAGGDEDLSAEGPVHRQLIRATLPRQEGQVPTRPAPEFTIRQSPAGPAKFRQPGNGRGPQRHRPPQGGPGGGPGRHAGGRPAGAGASGRRTFDRPHQRPFSPSRPSHPAPVARPGKKRSK